MREIRFRGKRTDNGAWVSGDVMQYLNGDCAIMPKNGRRGYGYEAVDCHKRFKVDRTTVGQSTGLQDRDGRDIYEGDILECFELNVEYEDYDIDPPCSSKMELYEVRRNTSAVTFEYGAFCAFEWPLAADSFIALDRYPEELRDVFDALWEDNCGEIQEKYPDLTWQDFGKFRVIGNVHDNPELLTKGDEK